MYGKQERSIQGFGENLRQRDVGVKGRIMLRWILKKGDGKAWTVLIWLRIGTIGLHL
jgi:hypothetical protein